MPEVPGAPFAAYIGAMLEEKGEGFSRLTLKTGPQHADRNGIVHPGVLTSIMDSVIGIGLSRLRATEPRDTYRPHATIEMSTSFYAQAAIGDDLVFEGRVTHLGEQVAFGEVETRRAENGEVIAKARLTFVVPGGGV
jgi:uncharacterized protein (TIGR00369 family)